MYPESSLEWKSSCDNAGNGMPCKWSVCKRGEYPLKNVSGRVGAWASNDRSFRRVSAGNESCVMVAKANLSSRGLGISSRTISHMRSLYLSTEMMLFILFNFRSQLPRMEMGKSSQTSRVSLKGFCPCKEVADSGDGVMRIRPLAIYGTHELAYAKHPSVELNSHKN